MLNQESAKKHLDKDREQQPADEARSSTRLEAAMKETGKGAKHALENMSGANSSRIWQIIGAAALIIAVFLLYQKGE